jgi:hypothetical protein
VFKKDEAEIFYYMGEGFPATMVAEDGTEDVIHVYDLDDWD